MVKKWPAFFINSLAIAFLFVFSGFNQQPVTGEITVPLGGNAFKTADLPGGDVDTSGIVGWKNPALGFISYIRVNTTGSLKLSLDMLPMLGSGTIAISVNDQAPQKVTTTFNDFQPVAAGEWQVKDTGYVKISFKAIRKTGNVFASIRSLTISGTAINSQTTFVTNNKSNFYHWGRRGPSVHLNYKIPVGKSQRPGAGSSIKNLHLLKVDLVKLPQME